MMTSFLSSLHFSFVLVIFYPLSHLILILILYLLLDTIKGGSRRAEKIRKVLMIMMKVAKLGWVEPAGQEQDWSKVRVGLKHEQGRSRAGTGQEQSRAE